MRFYTPVSRGFQSLPLASSAVEAGFPSPADDYLEGELDLNELLIANAPATFFVRAHEESMKGERSTIQNGDLLIVDKSRTPKNGDIVVAYLDGQFTVKRLRCKDGAVWLMPENDAFTEIRIEDEQELCIWGVVTARISQFP